MTRIKLTTLIALVLTVQAPGPVAHAKPPAADAAVANAEALYKARRFVAAARAFESLASRHVKYLYYAGLAYEAIGQDGQAITHWRLVAEAPEVEAGLRKRARDRAERAETRTTRLFISVTPAAAAPGATVELFSPGDGERPRHAMKLEALAGGIHLEGGTWKIEVRSEGREYSPATQQVTLSVRDAEKTVAIALEPITVGVFLTLTPREAASSLPVLTLRDEAGKPTTMRFAANEAILPLQLHPGLWRYHIEAPGFEQADGELFVKSGSNPEFSIRLTRRSGALKTRRLAIGAGISSVVFAAGGTAGLVLSEKKLGTLRTPGESEEYVDRDQASVPLDGVMAGSVVAGASVGFLATAVTAAIKRDRPRRRAWAAEAALGSLLGVGGGVWAGSVFFTTWKNDHLNAPAPSGDPRLTVGELKEYRRTFYPAMLMVGTGAALLVGSITGLALERRSARKPGRHAKARLRMVFPLTVDF